MKLRLRFKLTTLLVIVTVCAVLCATVWHFWPRFRAYQARMQFEKAAARIVPGTTMNNVNAIAGPVAWATYTTDGSGKEVGYKPYFFTGAWYVVYMEYASGYSGISSDRPCKSVKTFRLAVPPVNYAPQTQAAKDEVDPPETIRTKRMTPNGVIDVRASQRTGEDARRAAYIEDFFQQISGQAKGDLGIKYEELPGP